MTTKGRCASCGWTTKRSMKNMGRPCPKCGGAVYVHEDDQRAAGITAAVGLGIMLLVALFLTAVGGAKW